MYFYTGKRWKFKQEGPLCASTKSDIPQFEKRHFVKPPMSKFLTGRWAITTVSGTTRLQTAFKTGEKLEDFYKLTENFLLRVHTNAGHIDYRKSLEVTFAELPF
jgi:hypothetical protein